MTQFAPITSTSSNPFSIFNEPLDLAAVAQSAKFRPSATGARAQQSEYYQVETSVGLMNYPRVTSILDAVGRPWLARWVAKEEQSSFRTAAVEAVMSTQLGAGPLVARADVAATMERLRPEMASEKIKMRAADFGSRLHAQIEAHLKGTARPQSVDPELAIAFEHWREWWERSGLTTVQIEQRVACPYCGYGGTLDVLARDTEGRLWIVDWKSSKRISDEYSLQASAYGHAATLAAGPVAGAIVVRIPHTPRAKVEARRYEAAELAESFRAFEAALLLWRWQRKAAGHDSGDAPLGH